MTIFGSISQKPWQPVTSIPIVSLRPPAFKLSLQRLKNRSDPFSRPQVPAATTIVF